MTKAFAESCLVKRGNSEIFQVEQITLFFWELVFLIEPTLSVGVYVSVQGQTFFVFAIEWWLVKLAKIRFCLTCMYCKWGVENFRKSSLFTALQTFVEHLNISSHTWVHNEILKGRNLSDLVRDHFSLRTPLHHPSAVVFFIQCM